MSNNPFLIVIKLIQLHVFYSLSSTIPLVKTLSYIGNAEYKNHPIIKNMFNKF